MSEEEEPVPLELQPMGVPFLFRVQVRKEDRAVLDKGLREGKGGRKGVRVRKYKKRCKGGREGKKEGRREACACSTCVTMISSSFCINLASSMRAEMDSGK